MQFLKKLKKPQKQGNLIVNKNNEIVIDHETLMELKMSSYKKFKCDVDRDVLKISNPEAKPLALGTVQSWVKSDTGSGGQIAVDKDGNLVVSKQFTEQLHLGPQDTVEWQFDGKDLTISKGGVRVLNSQTVRSWSK